MKEIVILGAGDFGKEVAWLIEEINKRNPTYIILGYLDDAEAKIGRFFNGYECLGPISYLKELNKNHHACAVIANQDGDIRRKFVEMFPDFDDWETLVHPSVNISSPVWKNVDRIMNTLTAKSLLIQPGCPWMIFQKSILCSADTILPRNSLQYSPEHSQPWE